MKTEQFLVTGEPLNPRMLEDYVAQPGAGAIVTFTGVVRDNSDGRATVALEYEAYPEMAVLEMRRIEEEVRERWPGVRLAIHHRVGRLSIGEASVVIAVSAPHRAEAFAACSFAIDRLKEIVPVWKKDIGPEGATWAGLEAHGDESK